MMRNLACPRLFFYLHSTMKRFVILTAAAAFMSAAMTASTGKTPYTVSIQTPDGMRTITVTALNDNVLKVTNALIQDDEIPASRIAVLEPGGFSGTITRGDNGDYIISSPTGLTAFITSTGELTVTGGENRLVYDSGRRTVREDGGQELTLKTLGGAFHGAGERGHRINLSGDTLVMYNRQNYGYSDGEPRISQMNITMPLLVSPEGYAIVMDDFGEATMTAGNDVTYSTISKTPVSYYIVNSPDGFKGLPKELSALTGRQNLPPLWSLGYITSKYGYKNRHETDSVVATLKKKGYPLDGIVLDLYWYGKEEDMGRLDWDPDLWPGHRDMLAKLKKQGVNLVAISQPYVLRNGKGVDNFNELSAKGMLGKDSIGGTKDVKIWVGEGGMLDVSNPDTRAWLRERYRRLTDEGITGWWGDLGEPEVHPDGMRHANGLSNREYHNFYGNDWSSIINELFREEYPDTRLMTLMRGGTTGLQRNNVFPWSTDVSRSWGGLQPQVKIMLNSGLSGLGYMSHDVGGFAVDSLNPKDPELYVRWLQLGLFSPVLRTHSTRYAEPYVYEDLQEILLPLIKGRYEWLPYNYTLAYRNATEGLPLVRPVGMYSADPARYSDIDDEYLWGRDLLVAPVMRQGATSRPVTLPDGVWVDYNNPAKVFKGDTTIIADAPLEVLPLYVRGGALIPKAKYEMKNTLGYRTDNYTIEYYPTEECGKSECTIFEDDLSSARSLEKGEYALLTVSADNTEADITLRAACEGSFPGMAGKRTLTFEIHNVDAPSAVTATGPSGNVKVKTAYDASTHTIRITASSTFPLSINVK